MMKPKPLSDGDEYNEVATTTNAHVMKMIGRIIGTCKIINSSIN